jgi:hypothetical protein
VCCQQNVGGSHENSWNSFFLSTNQGLNGNEVCDCARNKYFNLENRVYRNKELNTVVAFFWLGRDLGINLRENMFTYPLQAACTLQNNRDIDTSLTMRSCNNVNFATSQFANVTLIGDAIRNITVSLEPDIFVMNWGHHTMYKWQQGFGHLQYNSITNAVKQLRADNYKPLFYWKTTTPVYSCEARSNSYTPGDGSDADPPCRLKLMKEGDGQNPTKLGNKLVQDRTLEIFDAQHFVKLLHAELRRRRSSRHGKKSGGGGNLTWCGSPLSMSYTVCQHNPLGWDSLHYYCWVNTELNRALIASYILKMKN